MGGESRVPFTSVWMMGLSWEGVSQDLCFQACGCNWDKNDCQSFLCKPLCRSLLADSIRNRAQYFSLCGLPCISARMDDAFAQREPPRPLIVLCQVGEVPVIVSQHSTVEVCLCGLMVFFMPALLAGCICCTALHLESFQNVGERLRPQGRNSGFHNQRVENAMRSQLSLMDSCRKEYYFLIHTIKWVLY